MGVQGCGRTYDSAGFSPASASSACKFTVGQRVESVAFGKGTVEAVQPMGNDTMLTICFDSGATKKLMANFAKLKAAD